MLDARPPVLRLLHAFAGAVPNAQHPYVARMATGDILGGLERWIEEIDGARYVCFRIFSFRIKGHIGSPTSTHLIETFEGQRAIKDVFQAVIISGVICFDKR